MNKILRYLLRVPYACVADRKTGEIKQSIYMNYGHSAHHWDENQQKYVDSYPYYETIELRKDLTKFQRIKIQIADALNVDLCTKERLKPSK